jgi:VanZ family protein
LKKISALLPSVLYYALIYGLSAQPNVRIGLDIPFLDKILHTMLYTGFGFCLSYSAARFDRKAAAPRFVVLLLLGAALGGLDEFHQSFVPGRNAEWGDAAVDVLGVLLGGLAFRRLGRTAFGKTRLRLYPPTDDAEA